MRIFVVEDSQSLRERLIRALSSIQGLEVIGFADNVTDAVQRIAASDPDVVLLDIRLNRSNGFQVLQAVKLLNRSPMVIVLTNFPYPQYRKRFLEAGASYFFDKSTEFNKVIEVLTRQLRQKQGAPNRAVPMSGMAAARAG